MVARADGSLNYWIPACLFLFLTISDMVFKVNRNSKLLCTFLIIKKLLNCHKGQVHEEFIAQVLET